MCPAVGKPGKKRSCPWKEPTANEWNNCFTASFIWRDNAGRRLVDAAAIRLCRIIDLHRLFHVGSVSGTKLFFWQLHLTILFARNSRKFTAQLVWTETRLVASLANLLSRVTRSLGAGWIPVDMLLLSRRLLQGILGGSAGMHGR